MSVFEQVGVFGSQSLDRQLHEAEQLCWDAFDSSSRTDRVRLAKKALSLSPNCADAYLILAQECDAGLEEQSKLWEQGVEAGLRAIGEEALEEDRGYFWGLLETRPYMRARQGLSQCLWELGSKSEAIAHARAMLELNPGDNQGVRYYLLAWLLDCEISGADKTNEVGSLISQFGDDYFCDWIYTHMLWLLHRNRHAEALGMLKRALKSNAYVPEYLCGDKPAPHRISGSVIFGSSDEAATYGVMFGYLWSAVSGAVDWLDSKRGELL